MQLIGSIYPRESDSIEDFKAHGFSSLRVPKHGEKGSRILARDSSARNWVRTAKMNRNQPREPEVDRVGWKSSDARGQSRSIK